MASRAAPTRSWGWLKGLVCGGLAVAAPGAAMMVAVLLLPGVAVYAVADRRHPGPWRAMLLAGAAAAFSPLRLLWDQGGTLAAGLDVLSDPSRPLLAWLSGGLAWTGYEVATFLANAISQAQVKHGRRVLEKEREGLVEEWQATGRP